MAGGASQAGDADSSRAPGISSGLQRSVNVLYCWCHSDSASVLLYFTSDNVELFLLKLKTSKSYTRLSHSTISNDILRI